MKNPKASKEPSVRIRPDAKIRLESLNWVTILKKYRHLDELEELHFRLNGLARYAGTQMGLSEYIEQLYGLTSIITPSNKTSSGYLLLFWAIIETTLTRKSYLENVELLVNNLGIPFTSEIEVIPCRR